jgi:hypothetical protein
VFQTAGKTPRRYASTTLRILTVLVVGLAAWTLYAISIPGGYFLLLMVVPMAWLVLGGAWLGLALNLGFGAGLRAVLKDRLLVGMAGIVILTAAAVVVDAPLRFRFVASQAAMDDVSAELSAPDAPAGLPDRWIGLFDAEAIEGFDGGFRFLVKDSGFLDPVGLAYSPGGPPPNIGGEDWYEPFHGPWWIWVESW